MAGRCARRGARVRDLASGASGWGAGAAQKVGLTVGWHPIGDSQGDLQRCLVHNKVWFSVAVRWASSIPASNDGL